jgi:multiple sugar transport system permease protein
VSGRLWKSLVFWLLLLPLVVVILFPYAVMLSTALKPRDEIFAFPPAWIPDRIALENFVDVWSAVGFGPTLLNSLLVGIGSTAVCLLVAVPAAYAMARMRFRGQSAFHRFLLVTQMLSPIVLVIGIFRMMAALGLIDSLWSLVVAYGAFNLAFAVWMLQSYFATIPKELEEAAWLDGAGFAQSLTLVFLPLALPALAVTAMLVFVFSWNEFVLALTLLRTPAKHVLTIRIFSLVGGAYTVDWHHVMAATLLATLPVAVLFAWLQRYLVRGLSLGAVR